MNYLLLWRWLAAFWKCLLLIASCISVLLFGISFLLSEKNFFNLFFSLDLLAMYSFHFGLLKYLNFFCIFECRNLGCQSLSFSTLWCDVIPLSYDFHHFNEKLVDNPTVAPFISFSLPPPFTFKIFCCCL